MSAHTTPETAPEIAAAQKLVGGRSGVFFVSPPSFPGRRDIPLIWSKSKSPGDSQEYWCKEEGNDTHTVVITILNTQEDDSYGPTEVSKRNAEGYTAIYIEARSIMAWESDSEEKGYGWTKTISKAVSSLKYQFVYVTSRLWNDYDSWGKTTIALAETLRERSANALIVVDEAELLYEFAETHANGGFYRGFPKKVVYRSLQGCNVDVGRRALDYATLPYRAQEMSAPILYLATATCPEHTRLSTTTMLDFRAQTVTVDPFPGLANVRFLRYDMAKAAQNKHPIDFVMRQRQDPRSAPKTLIYSSGAEISMELLGSLALMNGQSYADAPLKNVHWINSEGMRKRFYKDFNADKIPMLTTTPDFGAYTPALGARIVILNGTWEPTMMWRLAMRVDASRPALVIFMVESKKKSFYGKMKASFEEDELDEGEVMNPDQATVAISTTKVCLMVAWSLFFQTSSVPLNPASAAVIKEAEVLREKCGPCRCSNCKPEEAATMYETFGRITADNLDAVVKESRFG